MSIPVNFYGKYGEHFEYEKIDNDNYLVSCFVLEMKDQHCNKKELDELYKKYVTEGVDDFDKKNLSYKGHRALTLARLLKREYKNLCTKEVPFEKLLASLRIKELLKSVEVLELSDIEFKSYICGLENKNSDYAKFILRARKELENQK